MSNNRLVVGLAGLGALLLLVVLIDGFMGSSGFNSDRRYDGRFFRVDVKLAYKGEPHEISFVVGCKVHAVKYGDGSRTRDVGMIPAVYGHRMKDGQAVVVRPPDVCNGETTENKQVPPNFMPVIVVYDNADTLDFGRAYIEDDAYEGPLSEMTYGSTVITASNRDAWEEFRKSGPPNVVTRAQWWSNTSPDVVEREGMKPIFPPMGWVCGYRSRFEIPDALKPILRASPSFSAGTYWATTSQEEKYTTFVPMLTAGALRTPQFYVTTEDGREPIGLGDFRHSNPELGVMRRSGDSWIAPTPYDRTGLRIAPVYPRSSPFMARNWPADKTKWPQQIKDMKDAPGYDIEMAGGKTRGFAYCFSFPGWGPELTREVAKIGGHDTVDGKLVITTPQNYGNLWLSVNPFFYDDKFVLTYGEFGLMGGDI